VPCFRPEYLRVHVCVCVWFFFVFVFEMRFEACKLLQVLGKHILFFSLNSTVCHHRVSPDILFQWQACMLDCLTRRYAGLEALVASNADYVVDGLCRQLRHLDEHPRCAMPASACALPAPVHACA